LILFPTAFADADSAYDPAGEDHDPPVIGIRVP